MRTLTAVLALAATASLALGQQVPFDLALRRLRSPDVSQRKAALRQLVESGYPEAAAPIAALLNDPNQELRRAALNAELGLFLDTRIQTRRHVALVVEVRDLQPAARWFDEGLAALPVARVPADVLSGLLGPVRDDDPAFRIEATYALGILAQVDGGPPAPIHDEVAAALANRLGDPLPPARVAAARSAGRTFERCPAPCESRALEQLGEALLGSLNDPESDVRKAALQALGSLRSVPALPALTAGYERRKKGNDALASLEVIARIGHASSAAILRSALSHKDDRFRTAAAEGLARVGGADAAFAAQTLAGARPKAVQAARAFAAARTGDRSAIGALVRFVDDADTRLRARGYLVELGPAGAAAAATAIASGRAASRLALVEVLSAVGGAAELPAAESLLKDRDGAVAAAARRAALRINVRAAQ
jgi:HEAT repeat protein